MTVRYLLDTNACVDYLTGRYPAVAERLRKQAPDDFVMSAVVLAELRYGVEKSAHRKRNERALRILAEQIPPLDFDAQAAHACGVIRRKLERSGRPIGAYDLLIASQAKAHRLTVVTDNVREFGRVPGLKVENWRTG